MQFKMVAGALRYTRYGWLKRRIMRRIAEKAGGSTDTSRDHEYTDWADLSAFAKKFYSLCAAELKPRWDSIYQSTAQLPSRPAQAQSCRL